MERFIKTIDCRYSFFLLSLPGFVPVASKTSSPVIDNPYPELYRGCLALSATKIFFVSWVLFTVMEGGMSNTARFQRSNLTQ